MKTCRHGVPLDTFCELCQEDSDLEAERADPYSGMAFGDAQRFEDEQVMNDLAAGEGRDYGDESDYESEEDPRPYLD